MRRRQAGSAAPLPSGYDDQVHTCPDEFLEVGDLAEVVILRILVRDRDLRCRSAAFFMSAFIWTATVHPGCTGSSRSSICAPARSGRGRHEERKCRKGYHDSCSHLFSFDFLLLRSPVRSPVFLKQYSRHDDRSGQHQPGLFPDRVDTEDLFQVPDDQYAQRGEPDVPSPPRRLVPPITTMAIAESSYVLPLPVPLELLRRLADPRDAAEDPADGIGKGRRPPNRDPGVPCSFFVSARAYMCLPHRIRERNRPQRRSEAARTIVTTAMCPPACAR